MADENREVTTAPPNPEDNAEPTDETSIMFRKHASNRAVWGLLALAVVATVATLSTVVLRWNAATVGESGIRADTSSTDATEVQGTSLDTVNPVARQPVADITQGTLLVTASAPVAPTERDVLVMIILMGALGGLVHLTSSLTKFVGNGQLLRSWIPYYVSMPFLGASVAPIVYLLLRVGVLAPGAADQDTAATASLNLIGLYGFAGLTGLFARQAIEMLADVFTRIFRKVEAKDPIKDGGE